MSFSAFLVEHCMTKQGATPHDMTKVAPRFLTFTGLIRPLVQMTTRLYHVICSFTPAMLYGCKDHGPFSTAARKKWVHMKSQPSRPPGHPVLRYGFIFGGILAVLNLANLAIELLTNNFVASTQVINGTTTVNLDSSGISTLLTCFLFLVALALSLIAGLLAASASGKVGAATLAGLLTGVLGTLVSGIVGLIFIVILTLPRLQLPPGSTLTLPQLQGLLISTAIFGVVFGVLINGGLGAGTGALGGLIGRGRRPAPAPYYQTPYNPGWPGMPLPPGYPNQPVPPFPPQAYGGAPTYPPAPYPGQPGGGPVQAPSPSEG
jgi:hypothetical protein